MGFKDILERLGEKRRQEKEMFRQMQKKVKFQQMIEERMKSANERELERYMDEDREEMIKDKLEFMRKKRQNEINFGHNPLDTPNITNKTDWEVLKEKNQFKQKGCMFSNQPSVLKSNNKLLKNNKRLFGI